MELTKPGRLRGPLLIFFRELFVLSLCPTVRLTPGAPWLEQRRLACRASLPGEFFNQSAGKVCEMDALSFPESFYQAAEEEEKKRGGKKRVPQLCLSPAPSLAFTAHARGLALPWRMEVPLQLASIMLSRVALSSPTVHTGELAGISSGLSS